jgi:hypothetical protein
MRHNDCRADLQKRVSARASSLPQRDPFASASVRAIGSSHRVRDPFAHNIHKRLRKLPRVREGHLLQLLLHLRSFRGLLTRCSLAVVGVAWSHRHRSWGIDAGRGHLAVCTSRSRASPEALASHAISPVGVIQDASEAAKRSPRPRTRHLSRGRTRSVLGQRPGASPHPVPQADPLRPRRVP